MARFEWETEEDAEEIDLIPESTPSRRRRRALIVLTILFAVVALTTYWQLSRNVEARENLVEDDVSLAFELWTQAVALADLDVLNTLLIGSEAIWASSQRRMLAAGITLDRKMLGISLQELEADHRFADAKIDLSPDWQAAEITFELEYHLDRGEDVRKAIRLQQALSFKRVNGRWFLAQHDDAFWGAWEREEGKLLTIEFRQRDEDFANDLKRDLESDMVDACGRLAESGRCPEDAHVALRLESDPRILERLSKHDVPLLDGRTFLLPSPTLVGVPTDRVGYGALYSSLAGRVLEPFVASLTTPVVLPEQKVKILCYQQHDSVPRLYEFDARTDSWTLHIRDRAFRFISATADDRGLLLQEYLPGRSADRLRMAYVSEGQEHIVFDESFRRFTRIPIGWSGTQERPELLLFGFGSSPGSGNIGRINLDECQGPDCTVHELDGFPAWSPDKRRTIVTQGDMLYLGDGQGKIVDEIGRGFSAFWIDSARYGYARYLDGSAGYGAELVMSRIENADVHTLLDPGDLAGLLRPGETGLVFVDYASVNPNNRQQLFLSARSYSDELNRSYLISAWLPGDTDSDFALGDQRLRLTLDGLPRGYPGQATANGNVPFVFSPDGRWISLSRLESQEDNLWRVYVHDIKSGETRTFAARYPLYTFRYPLYDWSADGEWLILVDDGFLRLIAPAYDYERLILHDLHSCSHVAWSY